MTNEQKEMREYVLNLMELDMTNEKDELKRKTHEANKKKQKQELNYSNATVPSS